MPASSSPLRDPAIQISRVSFRGSSSPLVSIVLILTHLFPPHVGEIRELLVHAAALAVAIPTTAIIRRPSPQVSSSQQHQAQGSPSPSPPLLSLDFASFSYSSRLVCSSSSLAYCSRSSIFFLSETMMDYKYQPLSC